MDDGFQSGIDFFKQSANSREFIRFSTILLVLSNGNCPLVVSKRPIFVK
jgi:hypothetical protein